MDHFSQKEMRQNFFKARKYGAECNTFVWNIIMSWTTCKMSMGPLECFFLYIFYVFVHIILEDHSSLVDEIDPTDLVEETEMLQTPQR